MSNQIETNSSKINNPLAKPSDFVGTWKLQSWQEFAQNGDVSYPFGADCFGRITYTEDGFMNAVLMQSERAKVGTDTSKLKQARSRLLNPLTFLGALPQAGALARYAKATAGYVNYGGRYFLKENSNKVVHTVDYSLIPDWIGGEQVRTYTFSDNSLTLEVNFGESHQKLVWQRL